MNTCRLSFFSLGLCALVACGCATGRGPFAAKPEPPPPGIKVPHERAAELKALAASIGTREPADQESVAAQLAQEFQRESDPLIREQIVHALGKCSVPTAAAVLREALKDPDVPVRVAVCEALAHQPPPLAVPSLAAALAEDRETDVRLAAARALGSVRDRASLAPLAEALADPNPALQYRVAISLRELSGRDFGTDVEAWRRYAATGEGQDKPISLAERLRGLF